MSFEIPDSVQKLRDKLVAEFSESVVPVTCNTCGNKTVMNAFYAQHVKDGIASCSKCRKN